MSASKLANHTSDLMPLHGLWQHSANFYLWLLVLTNVVQTGNAGCIFSPFIDKYRLLLCSVLEVNVRFLLQLNYTLPLRVSLLPPWKRHTLSPRRGTDLVTYAG